MLGIICDEWEIELLNLAFQCSIPMYVSQMHEMLLVYMTWVVCTFRIGTCRQYIHVSNHYRYRIAHVMYSICPYLERHFCFEWLHNVHIAKRETHDLWPQPSQQGDTCMVFFIGCKIVPWTMTLPRVGSAIHQNFTWDILRWYFTSKAPLLNTTVMFAHTDSTGTRGNWFHRR